MSTDKEDFSSLIPFFNSLPLFDKPNLALEQYSTPINILESYFNFFPTHDMDVVVDLGIGTGILSFLAIKLGSRHVIGLDIDKNSLYKTKSVAEKLKISNLSLIQTAVEFFPISKFKNKINGVIMNPPFGTKRSFIDFVFLKKALQTNGWILTLHKNNRESKNKLNSICLEYNYLIKEISDIVFPLYITHNMHKKNIHPVDVSLFLLSPSA